MSAESRRGRRSLPGLRHAAVTAAAAIVAGSAAWGLQPLAAQRGTPNDPCAGSRDLRLTNGRFVTMDARGTTASELVIQNGRIASVGSSRRR